LKFLRSSNFSKYTETYVTTAILLSTPNVTECQACIICGSESGVDEDSGHSVADLLEELTASVLICHEDGGSRLLCSNGNYLVLTI
jgi:hypothetical protein